MKIVTKRLSEIRPYEKNPRRNDEAVRFVANSVRSFGWRVPIVIDKDGVIVCGHTRYKAARQLGLDTVPCVVAEDLTEEQVNAFRLIDNKTQELSYWDFGKLSSEFDLIGKSFDMLLFGFASMSPEEEEEEGHDGTGSPKKSTNTDSGMEIDVGAFAEEVFECQCPECGFRFNE